MLASVNSGTARLAARLSEIAGPIFIHMRLIACLLFFLLLSAAVLINCTSVVSTRLLAGVVAPPAFSPLFEAGC